MREEKDSPWLGVKTVQEFIDEQILVDDLPIGIEERLKVSIYANYFTMSSINSLCPHYKEVDYQSSWDRWVEGRKSGQRIYSKNTAQVYRLVLISYSDCEGNENQSVICLECLLKELNKGVVKE